MGVKVVFLGIVVGRGCYDHKVGVLVGCHAVKRRGEVQPARDARCLIVPEFAPEIFLDVFVLDGTDPLVDLLDFLGDYVHGCHFVMLREESRDAQADVTGAGHGYLNVVKLSHNCLY